MPPAFVFALAAAFADPAAPPVPSEEDPTWQQTLEAVVPSVVSLRVTAVRDFDTEDASVSQGTGFVVDAERGLILTNRHMVHAGPVVAQAVFLDHEEVPLVPIYRDPVHDFGFYAFDPALVKHQEVRALPLEPTAARVGLDIRVVGNDAGEKISILDGTLARLDRNPPIYGEDTYNDVNTFYFQAASNTSGGSSGSPVVDRRGRVVALNAGGATEAASSFYLPLDRVVRAFDLLRQDRPVPRGGLQATFLHVPFDELRRLGLTAATEERVRGETNGSSVGLLVVEDVLPESPAEGALASGDILVEVDGRLVTGFTELDALLDERVDQQVTLVVERGGERLEQEVLVSDLHALSPSTFLEQSRGIFHELSLVQARNHHRPVRGVYVAVPGYAWSTGDVPSGAVVTELDGVPVPDLATFQRELEGKADNQRMRVRFELVSDPHESYETVVVNDRRWHRMARCTRNDTGSGTGAGALGTWPCVEAPPPPPLVPAPPPERLPGLAEDRVARRVGRALVLVEFDIPHPTAGVKDLNYVGVGTVIDAERGLVLVDRDTVPVSLGDMTLTFEGTLRVPGHLVYLHPMHDVAVIGYDPALLGDLGVEAVELDASPLRPGDRVWQVGLDAERAVVSVKTRVDVVEPVLLGVSGTPRFRDTNVDGVDLEDAVDSYGGVLADRQGHVRALWASFLDPVSGDRTFHGLPVGFLSSVLEPLRAGGSPVYRTLGVELSPLSLAVARDRGLPDEWVRRLVDADPHGRRVLEVQRVDGRAPSEGVLRDTDLLLAVEGRPLTTASELEPLLERPSLEVTILRDGEERDVRLDTFPLSGTGVDRALSWAGMVLHEPHGDVAAQQGIVPQGVYVAWLWYGSPGSRFGVRPTRAIVAVDGVPTPTLDTFLDAVRGLVDGQTVRLEMEKLDGRRSVSTLQVDLAYWPTQVLEFRDGAWTRTEIGGAGLPAREGGGEP